MTDTRGGRGALASWFSRIRRLQTKSAALGTLSTGGRCVPPELEPYHTERAFRTAIASGMMQWLSTHVNIQVLALR